VLHAIEQQIDDIDAANNHFDVGLGTLNGRNRLQIR
jgi:hypothetical protein